MAVQLLTPSVRRQSVYYRHKVEVSIDFIPHLKTAQLQEEDLANMDKATTPPLGMNDTALLPTQP